MTDSMRSFGLNIAGHPISKTVELCKVAEKSGFDTVWLPDESPSPPFRDVTVAITMCLLNTSKVRVGSSIFVPYTRHPALLSVFVSSICEIGEGRVILGLGPGGSMTLMPLGLPMWDRPLVAMREAIMIVRKLLSGEKTDYEGEIFKLKGIQLPFVPRKKVPIYLAARGVKMLELAGEVADGCILSAPEGYLGFARDTIKKGAERVGRKIEDVELVNSPSYFLSDDKKKAIDVMRSSAYFKILDSPDVVHKKIGTDLRMIELARKALRDGDSKRAISLISDEAVEKFTILGSSDECIEKIDNQFKFGLSHILLNLPHGVDTEEMIMKTGREIIPAFA